MKNERDTEDTTAAPRYTCPDCRAAQPYFGLRITTRSGNRPYHRFTRQSHGGLSLRAGSGRVYRPRRARESPLFRLVEQHVGEEPPPTREVVRVPIDDGREVLAG